MQYSRVSCILKKQGPQGESPYPTTEVKEPAGDRDQNSDFPSFDFSKIIAQFVHSAEKILA